MLLLNLCLCFVMSKIVASSLINARETIYMPFVVQNFTLSLKYIYYYSTSNSIVYF